MRVYIFIVLGVFWLASACNCSVHNCLGSSPLFLVFEGYNEFSDSTFIQSFEKGSNFTTLIEEGADVIIPREVNGRMQAELFFRSYTGDLEVEDCDFRVVILSDTNEFFITDLAVNREPVEQQCGLFSKRAKQQSICPIVAMSVNGIRANLQADQTIVLRK